MGTKPADWKASQVYYWHVQYEGSYLRCPVCESVLSIEQALDDGCPDCETAFDLAHKEADD